jgi:hypothetical protein
VQNLLQLEFDGIIENFMKFDGITGSDFCCSYRIFKPRLSLPEPGLDLLDACHESAPPIPSSPPPLLDPNPITLSRSPCSYLLHVDDEALIQLPEPNLGDALRLLPTP